MQKTVRWFLKKLNTELPYDPAILLLGIYPKELKTGTQKLGHIMFKAVLVTIAQLQLPNGGNNPSVHQQMSG